MPRSEQDERADLWASFDAARERSIAARIRHGCLSTFRPVLDEGPEVRVFDTMEDYRKWCDENLPEWMGYRRVTDEEWQYMLDHALDEPGKTQA